jgi:hypothetical protein
LAITYEPPETWRGRGRPPAEVPEALVEALETTYTTGKVATDQADEHSAETRQILALMRIHCRRRGMVLDHQFYDGPDGLTYLRFRMRKPRSYQHQLITPQKGRRR